MKTDCTNGIHINQTIDHGLPSNVQSEKPVREWTRAVIENDFAALISHYEPLRISHEVLSKHLQTLEKAGLIARKRCA